MLKEQSVFFNVGFHRFSYSPLKCSKDSNITVGREKNKNSKQNHFRGILNLMQNPMKSDDAIEVITLIQFADIPIESKKH
jgi:hypothetical protein